MLTQSLYNYRNECVSMKKENIRWKNKPMATERVFPGYFEMHVTEMTSQDDRLPTYQTQINEGSKA